MINVPVHSVVRIGRQNKLTNLKRTQKTEFVSPVLVLGGQDEHPGCSSSRAGGSKSELSPFSFSLTVFTSLPSKFSCKCNLDFLF